MRRMKDSIVKWCKDFYWGLYWITWAMTNPHEKTGENDDD
jgi:hypothetical protein